jgi:carbamate kinase
LDYGGEDERPLRSVDTDELRAHLDADEFGEGTMRPKVEAALGFVESNDGVEAVITTPERFEDALDGDSGTRLRR